MLGKILVFFCVSLIFSSHHAFARINKEPFGNSSFSIWTTVFDPESNDLRPIAHLKESYSVDQRRARIDIDEFGKEAKSGTFYHYSTKDMTVYTKNMDNKTVCTQSSIDLFNYKASLEDLPLEFGQNADEFIIGPAKLIFFVSSNFDLKDLPKTESVDDENKLKFFHFNVTYNGKQGRTYTLALVYDEASIVQEVDNPIPLIIRISTDKRQHTFAFSRPEVLNSAIARDKQTSTSSGGQVTMDYFAFRLGAGCSTALKGHDERLFFEKGQNFAFTAKEEYSSELHENTWKQTIYVAYENSLGALRIDKSTGGRGSRTSSQLYEFNIGRSIYLSDIETKSPPGKVVDVSLDETNTQCVITTLAQEETGNKPVFSKLLFGAESFVYMGKAKVRGMSARVYESSIGAIPYWLDNPVPYIDSKGDEGVRESEMDEKLRELRRVNVVLYLLDDKEQHNSILMFEIEKTRPPVEYIDSKQSFAIYNFNWDLESEAPDGSREDELFSFGSKCLTNKSPEFRLKFDLSKDHVFGEVSSLNVPSSRNLALLSMVQQTFFVQASMVSDVESKVSVVYKNQVKTALIRASIRFKSSPKKLVLLKYHGQGIGKQNSKMVQLRPGATTMHDCLNMASLLRYNVYFGFDPVTSSCLIDTNNEDKYADTDSTDQKGPFKISKNYFFEVYSTIHTSNISKTWRFNQGIEDLSKCLNKEVALVDNMRDTTLQGFKITSATLEDNRKKIVANVTDQVDKISGFGLLPSDVAGAKSWIMTPLGIVDEVKAEDVSESEMTIDQCKTACMVDFSCKSYSTCLKDSRIQCTLSELPFTSKAISDQLNTDKITKAKRNSRVKVNMTQNASQEPLTIELLKNPTCEINNKIYLDFHRLATSYHADAEAKDVYQSTENLEDCARMCLEANLQPIQADVSKYLDKNKKMIINSDTSEFFRERFLMINRHICIEFLYSSRIGMSAKLVEDLNGLSLNSDQIKDQESVKGYCFFEKNVVNKLNRAGAAPVNYKPKSKVFLRTMRFYFNFETLYSVTHGVKLGGTPLNAQEQEALQAIFKHDGLTEYQLLNFEGLTKTRFNHQRMTLVDVKDIARKCANECAFQVRQLYPSCRSFDVVTEFHDSQTTSRCFINSITLKEAKASSNSATNNLSSLIEYNSKKSRQVWHFEPKAGFVLSESMLIYDLEHHHPVLLKSSSSSTFGLVFSVLFVVALGMVCGLLLGVQSGRKLVDYSNQYRRESTNDSFDLNNIQ